jgi:hypothetical protein
MIMQRLFHQIQGRALSAAPRHIQPDHDGGWIGAGRRRIGHALREQRTIEPIFSLRADRLVG